ncbi:hypothetical protein D3C77_707140 [compost metagenome]
MAEHACGQGQQVHQDESAKWRGFWQQEIQYGGGGGHIQGGDQQLQRGEASARQAQGATAQLYQ